MSNILITGGAGFIGCNYAVHLIEGGHNVTIFDDLSRKGAAQNLAWLQASYGADFRFIQGDVRDAEALRSAARDQGAIFHLAAQVAVTSSVTNPREDFEINALGTFNVLEAARLSGQQPLVVYASTNKVYGGMEDVRVVEQATRWAYADLPHGLPETQPLDFHSPYGCCYSEDTDILTRRGWRRFYELAPDDEVLTYNLERKLAEYQRPTAHFAFPYEGRMYVQSNRRLKTCVTPNHRMLVAWDCNHEELKNPRLMEAQLIQGQPFAYLLAAEVEGGQEPEHFVLPEVKAGKYKHHSPAKMIPLCDWLRFLGWYISEGHCYENQKTGNCTITLTTYHRTDEAIAVMQAIGLSPVVDQHHVTATSRQLYEYVKMLGKSHEQHIPQPIKELSPKYLHVLLRSLLDGDGNAQSRNSWRYTTVSRCLADDVQEIAVKCGMASSVTLDAEGCCRVYIGTTRTTQCNQGGDRSEWVDYAGKVYCVEVPNSVVMVRQNGHAYFSGNSKGAGDQYVRDYARIYGLRTVVLRQSCLAAEQEVITPFGKKPIADLQPGDLVHSGQGWTKVVAVWQTGTKPVRRLTTMNGLSVSLTEDHHVFRPHGLYPNRDFAYGDFLAVLPEAHYTPGWEPIPDKVLNPECYLDAVRARTSDARCLNEAARVASSLLPLRGDSLLAITEIVGRLYGDGHLGIHRRASRSAPAYTVQHFGSAAELTEVGERLAWLGLPASGIIRSAATSLRPDGHIIEGHSCRIQQQSIPIFTLFELLGVPVGDKVRVDYALPEWVAHGHRLVKRAFLRGFFGAELTKVNANSCLAPSFSQSKDVTHRESGRRWIQQLRNLLAEFEIKTSCFEADPVEYKRGTTIQTTVRLLGGRQMFERLAEIGYAFSAERSTCLNALLRWQWQQTAPDRFETIAGLYRADGQLFWDSLARIESLGERAVYDIEVEAESHLFVAGGIQVSNCIYGPRQFGIEDQGWLAHFVIAVAKGRPINIYGDGKQVRDMLWVDDLIAAFDIALQQPDTVAGRIYNIGGGPDFTFSIWCEVEPHLRELAARDISVRYDDWRPGDQKVYISDVRAAARDLGWQPTVAPEEGLKRLWNWVTANIELFD